MRHLSAFRHLAHSSHSSNPTIFQMVEWIATVCGGASRGGTLPLRARCLGLLMLASYLGPGCAAPVREARPPAPAPAQNVRVATAPAPSAQERYCAWYGASDGRTLYFGEAAFWATMRAHGGDPRADLLAPGPQPIGRFDLEHEALLPPIEVARPDSRSGVWDVLPSAGSLWFTTFFELSGRVDASGAVERLAQLGTGLNEIAPGPQGGVVISRYAAERADADGSVLWVDAGGKERAEWALVAPTGYRVAPKTVAWDPRREQLWVTSDLLPLGPGAVRHDAYRLDRRGALQQRFAQPELQFVAFGADGSGFFAEAQGALLTLRIQPPPGVGPARTLTLDDAFAAGFDFVQDVQPMPDGRAVVTRWSGLVHVVGRRVATLRLPRLDPQGLYYTGVLHGGRDGRERLCATYCADVTVVCADAPE